MSGKDKKPSTPQWLAQTLAMEYAYEALNAEGKEAGFSTLRYWRGEWFNWADGRYAHVSDETLKMNVTRFLQDEHDREPESVPKVNGNLIGDVITNLKPHVMLPDSQELNAWLSTGKAEPRVVSVRNGLVEADNPDKDLHPSIREHTPDYFTLSCLPFNYDPDATCPRWDQFLQEVLPKDLDSQTMLQEWVGYLFRPDLREQKFLLLSGEGANGKTVFTDVIEALIGAENCSHVPLACFGDRFALHPTVGKVANITTESSGMIEQQAETALKAMTSGDPLNIDRKHRDALQVRPTAKVMIATNDLPRFTDRSRGIWRRMLYIPFEQTFTEDRQDKRLTAYLIEHELPGIFNWALRGLYWLNNKGGFTVSERSEQAKSEYERMANPARTFLEDSLVTCSEGEVPSADLYGGYRSYCEANGYYPLNNAHFGREVCKVFPTSRKTIRKIDDARKPVYAGVAIRTASELSSCRCQR